MKKVDNLILEAQLSKAYLTSIEKLVGRLINEVKLNEREARYLTNLYTELKHLNLFNAKYFKEFEYEGDLINFADIGAFAKDPETFAEVMLEVFHAGKFQELFKIDYNPNTYEVSVTKKNPNVKEKKPEGFKTPYTHLKVNEDANWITFRPSNHSEGASLRNFYASMYPELTRKEIDMLTPTWCVISSSSGHFERQKGNNPGAHWYITYSKKPIKELLAHIKHNEQFSSGSSNNPLNKYAGEIYLTNPDGPDDRKIFSNFGPHHFTNDPGTAVAQSALVPPVSYKYTSEAVEPFIMSGNKLIKCNLNDEVIEVPLGVVEIAEGAFESHRNLVEVILPPTVTRISKGAFIDNPNLHIIEATNNLTIVESDAISPIRTSKGTVLVGVIDYKDNGDIILLKPSRLRFMQPTLLDDYEDLQEGQDE